MTKRWGYIQFALLGLLIVLGWQIADRWIFKEKIESPLESALHSAGSNRKELEKVLRHYQQNPADSLKYKAACFLIENMPFYSYACGEQLEKYKNYYAWLKPSGKSPEAVVDSVRNTFGPIGTLETKCDILEIDSAYLCNNIEWAFKVWKEQPWGKNVSFDIFCEYILPHRIDNESLIYWREMYYEKYNSLLDELRESNVLDKEDPAVAANFLRQKMLGNYHYFTSVAPFSFGHIGPEYVQYMSGSCIEATDFGVYLFRALGIPCTIDFVPVRSYINGTHFWLVVKGKDGEEYKSDFPGTFDLVRRCFWFWWEDGAKTYRYTYSVNRKMFETMAKYGEEIDPFWHIPKFIDVTRNYAYYYQKELQIPSSRIYKEKRNGKIAYLCFSSRDSWVPIDWTEYDRDNLIIRNFKKGALMRLATYEEGALCFVTDPFYVDKWTNEICFYAVEKEKQDVVLFSKCSLSSEDDLRSRMIGGVFEGSNHSDFKDKDTIFIIQKSPSRLYTEAHSWSDKKYRYVRYVGPANSWGNVAEIAFYASNDTIPLKGRMIGTPGCSQEKGSHEYTNVFDGKTWTSFDYSQPSGGWTGQDFGKEIRVDRIVYTPRNRDNYVRLGDVFELFYCDGDWKSAGIIRAVTDSLVYHNVPKNALLLLRNHSHGVDERVFVYENGVQLWK